MVNLALRLTFVVQAALLLLALQHAATPANAFWGRGRPLPVNAETRDIAPSVVDISSPTTAANVFEHADIPTKRRDLDDKDEDEDEDEDDDFDELEIITVFLPEQAEDENEDAVNVLHKRAGPTPCPANHTRRHARSLPTAHPNEKRHPKVVYRTRTRTRTVTVTKTIYETVYRRCTEYVRRATSSKRKTTSTKRRSTTSSRKPTSTRPALAQSTSRKTTSTSSRRTTSSTRRSTLTTSSRRTTSSTSTRRTTSTTPKPSSSSTNRALTTSSTTPKPSSSSTTPRSSTTSTSTTPKSSTTSTSTVKASTSSSLTIKTSTSSSSTTSTTPRAIPSSTSSSSTSTSTSTSTSSSTTTSSTTTSSTVTPTPTPKVYNLMANYSGANFYDNMYFFTYKDPTNGLVDYIGRDEASSMGLVKTTNGGQVYMAYATTRVYPSSSTTTSASTSTTSTSSSTSTSSARKQRRAATDSSSASTTSSSSASSAATSSSSSSGDFGAQAVGTTSSSKPGTATTASTDSSSTTSSSTTSTSSAAATSSAAPIPYMKSVRVSSYDTFTTGVFILDASHMPVGCGVWPAWWTVPTNPAGGWPNGGEIDVVEGISFTSQNTYSIHTAPGCRVNSTTNTQLGTYQLQNLTLATNCASAETSNQGCGVQSSLRNDYGTGYNAQGGGIHAMVWDEDEGIKAWFWSRSNVPSDIGGGKPDPTGWGEPQASWPAEDCDPNTFFFNHVSVFTNTICGDWAGNQNLWNNAYAGQTQSCAKMTGYPSCQAYVQSKDVDFSQAYWLINSVKIYQTKRTY